MGMYLGLEFVSMSIWVGLCKCSVFEWCVCHCGCVLILCVRHCKVPGLGMRPLGWEGEFECILMLCEGVSILSGEFA